MEYYFSTILAVSFEEAIVKTTEALKTQGFGIVSEIDMQAKLKEKLGIDYKKYKILGACNPAFAYQALQEEEMVGTMLPCNFVVIDKENGSIEIAAVHPVASMMAIKNPNLEKLALEVTGKIKKVFENLY
jgi:uncharacterized protein (DUF302 family)